MDSIESWMSHFDEMQGINQDRCGMSREIYDRDEKQIERAAAEKNWERYILLRGYVGFKRVGT